MREQISPWSFYDTSFQTVIKQRSGTMPQKQVKKRIDSFQAVQPIERVQKVRAIQEQPKSVIVNGKQNLKHIEKFNLQSKLEEIRHKVRLQKQRKPVYKLLEQKKLQKYIHNQLSNWPGPPPLPRIRHTKIHSQRSETVNQESLTHFSETVLKKQPKVRFSTLQNRQRLATIINYSPFDDFDILRRGIQLMKKRKRTNKERKSFLVYKLTAN